MQGLALGFASGMAPGPLLAVVVAASLRGGFRSGLLASIAPLITDIPIITVCLVVLANVPDRVASGLAVLGGAVLTWYAYEVLRDARRVSLSDLRSGAAATMSGRRAFWQGVLANALNPSPWLFWMSAGGALLTDAWRDSPVTAIAFVVPFYALLVGSKVALAWGLGASGSRLSDAGYRALLAGAGTMLVLLAGSLYSRGLPGLLG